MLGPLNRLIAVHGDSSDRDGGAALREKEGREKKRKSGGSRYFVKIKRKRKRIMSLNFVIFYILIQLIILFQNLLIRQ